MFTKSPILIRLFIFIVFPVLIVLFIFFKSVGSSVTQYDGEVLLEGISNKVVVLFDKQGVPTIKGKHDSDVYFVQGYLHASERLWQLETQRRFVKGQTSEIFGETSLSIDVWMKILNLRGAAEKSWDSLSNETKAALEAYSNGINTWIKEAHSMPPEFKLLNISPKAWSPLDSLAWQKAFAMNLGGNMGDELSRSAAKNYLNNVQMKTFFPYDNNEDDIFNDFKKDLGALNSWQALKTKLNYDWNSGNKYSGSNAWVVNGKYTTSGFPILANDPHLGVQRNSLWYAIEMVGASLHVTGMSMVGIPGVILGRNQNISWGATNLMSDQQDLFEIRLLENDSNKYQIGDENFDIQTVDYEINVRNLKPELISNQYKPVKVKVRYTEHGPVISDAFGESSKVLVLRWAALDKSDRSIDAFYSLQYAKNWHEFRTALSFLKAPGLNFLYADEEGNIGSQVAGSIPIRGSGVGTLPQTLFSLSDLWQGYVPFDSLPNVYNPESGVVISANNLIETSNYIISHEWASDARKNRIAQLLNESISKDKKLNIEDMARIQLDVVDLGVQSLLKVLLNEDTKTKILEKALNKELHTVKLSLDELSNWEAEFREDLAAPSIYTVWINELLSEMFESNLSVGWSQNSQANQISSLAQRVSEEQLLKELPNSSWCTIESRESNRCENEIIQSFFSALRVLKKKTGTSNMSDWHWGKLHYIEYSHQLFSKSKLLKAFFSTKRSAGGSDNSINMANIIDDQEGGFRQTLSPTFRQVFDMDKQLKNNSAYVLSTGQSGHFLSKHYEDQLESFIKGQFYFYLDEAKSNVQNQPVKDSRTEAYTQLVLKPLGDN